MLLLLLVLGCGSDNSQPIEANQVEAVRSDIELTAFVYAHEAGAAVLDVRTKPEFDGGHVPGAVNLPLDKLNPDALEGFDKTQPVFVICASGGRSARASDQLAASGWM